MLRYNKNSISSLQGRELLLDSMCILVDSQNAGATPPLYWADNQIVILLYQIVRTRLLRGL